MLRLWEDTRFTVLFVTHSIPEAVKVGSHILLLSAHPGRVRTLVHSDGSDRADTSGLRLSERIHRQLFESEPVAKELVHAA